jgi:hypothetical protein
MESSHKILVGKLKGIDLGINRGVTLMCIVDKQYWRAEVALELAMP